MLPLLENKLKQAQIMISHLGKARLQYKLALFAEDGQELLATLPGFLAGYPCCVFFSRTICTCFQSIYMY